MEKKDKSLYDLDLDAGELNPVGMRAYLESLSPTFKLKQLMREEGFIGKLNQ